MAKTKKHPGTLTLRGSSWRLCLFFEGKRHDYTLGAMSREEAEEAAWDKQRDLQKTAQRTRLGLPGPLPFSALLERFKAEKLPLLAPNTRRTYQHSLARFDTYFVGVHGGPRVDQIRAGHVKGFLSWRRSHLRQGGPKGAKPAEKAASNRTLAKDRAVLHAVFGFAEELELREGNPVAKVRPPRADTRDPVLLSEEQFEALLGECQESPMLRLYVLALGETGGRCESEVLFLRWEDVDLEQGFLWISSGRDGHRTKSGKGRWSR